MTKQLLFVVVELLYAVSHCLLYCSCLGQLVVVRCSSYLSNEVKSK